LSIADQGGRDRQGEALRRAAMIVDPVTIARIR